jgi:hypothetical protein
MAKTQVMEKKRTRRSERPETTAAATATTTIEQPTCQHHWVIDSPRGAMSPGRCKRCGEEREFRNSTSDYVWDDDSSKEKGYTPWRGTRSSPKMIDDVDTSASGIDRDVAVV